MKLTAISLRKKVLSLAMVGTFLFTLPLSFVACSDDDDDDNGVTITNNEENTGTTETTNTDGNDENTSSSSSDGNGNGQSGGNTTGGSVNSGKMFMGFDTVATFGSEATADEITTKILSLTSDTTLKLNGAINAVTLKAIAAAMQENDSVQIALDLSDTTGIVEWKDWFAGATTLYAISLPKTVTTVQVEVFSECSKLKAVTIPSSLQKGNFVWSDTNIEYIYFTGTPAEWTQCSIVCRDNITLYLNGILSTEITGTVVIPDSVTSIKDNAFRNWKSLESIVIPESIKSIGYYPFDGCTSLTIKNISLPNIEEIYSYAFFNLETLESISIGSSIKYIDTRAFWGCSALTSATFADPDMKWNYEKHKDNSTEGGSDRSLFTNDTEQNAKYLTDSYYSYYSKTGSYYTIFRTY